ncbi:hypothetical protein [uncultured Corynebacterium sp.]|nr:hypothetical protein [uncultured Corynebacterium sp.]
MDFTAIIALVNDLLRQADMATYTNWDVVSRVLDAIIPDAAANYRP